MITTEWKDFVLSAGVPIETAKDRFDLGGGHRRVQRELFEQFGERFEVMEISELGDITVWTTSKVWCIRKDRPLEKLINLPRNPPAPKG